jgi:hypothetical protein
LNAVLVSKNPYTNMFLTIAKGHPKHTYLVMVKYLEKWAPVTEESTRHIAILYSSLLISVIYGNNNTPFAPPV